MRDEERHVAPHEVGLHQLADVTHAAAHATHPAATATHATHTATAALGAVLTALPATAPLPGVAAILHALATTA